MEKNVAHPTDSNLLDRGRKRIVKKINQLKSLGLSVFARSFDRLGRKQILTIAKLGRGRGERIAQGTKALIEYANEVLKAVPRAIAATKRGAGQWLSKKIAKVKEELLADAALLAKVVAQAKIRLDDGKCKEKVLSMHEPNVVVIAKGKRSKRYEFGCKVSLSMDKNGYILGHQEYHHNIADVNSLAPAISDWQKKFGDYPDELAADRGYSSANITEEQSKVRTVAIPTRGRKRHPDSKKHYFRRLQKLRNRIEPTIGHLKTDHRMNKSRYKGKIGDQLNVAWAVIAWNLKKCARAVA